ncbi:MAG TPA: tRNA 2-thiouridine(34) synthase MnmA [Flavobacteriales bacterium]|jgi:tRNA-specific 2-thiouridylase|nr:tRNA 2-thiouridine(34) synthase MnmA [Flavobacteriales bacterium]HIB77595.1 tRNA 2-thiouridine(34) synthase MnmA [Flavobacteriales bacterium]HIN42030.1 tRNA 2-thiouridine(34) synthase MnmA [Flavobacteriales bacterium]HIO16457.1 tRNA 2-thiouridine(34) synthase MnmA [Flavobacteriales bacterium]
MRIVVGLSGGVDSSVAALELVEQGHEVIGLFMRNWHDTSVTISDECPWIDDSNDAMLVAEHLGIPFQVIDFSKEYHERIVDYMFSEYEQGRTPNPDVLCNREIKFDLFLDAAKKLGAEAVATGHYCRKSLEKLSSGNQEFQLIAGSDPNKDQSYFLCQLTQDQLKYAMFPIGDMLKPNLRKVAKEAGLPTADKKDSQGLCFIGKVRLPEFLQQKLSIISGDIIEIDRGHEVFSIDKDDSISKRAEPFNLKPELGKKVGNHQGAHFYTIGQRKGLNIGGNPEPIFVIGTDVKSNTVYVGQGDKHPGLLRRALKVNTKDIHWVLPSHTLAVGQTSRYSLRFRYRQPLQSGEIVMTSEGLYLKFDEPQRGIAAGQFAVWYDGEKLVGSGPISA